MTSRRPRPGLRPTTCAPLWERSSVRSLSLPQHYATNAILTIVDMIGGGANFVGLTASHYAASSIARAGVGKAARGRIQQHIDDVADEGVRGQLQKRLDDYSRTADAMLEKQVARNQDSRPTIRDFLSMVSAPDSSSCIIDSKTVTKGTAALGTSK